MMSILVTGTPGSGKTTLVAYARAHNNQLFFDADEIVGLCEWREYKTGKVLGLVTEHAETGLDDWYEKYGWYWRANRLKDFLNDNPNAIVCGSAENIDDFYKFFERIIILRVTADQLAHNLASPDRSNPFGNTENQRKNFMNWQDFLIDEAKKYKPLLIDGNSTENAYKQIMSKP